MKVAGYRAALYALRSFLFESNLSVLIVPELTQGAHRQARFSLNKSESSSIGQ